MLKFVFVLCVTVALIMPMHETQAFKVINIYKGAPQSTTASAPAPAFNPSALIQGVQSAIAGKLQQVQSLVGSIVQQKTALKQNALNSIQSTLGSFKSQVQSTAGSASPRLVYRKSVYIGGIPSAAAPEATTHADVDATTTTN